MPKEINGLNAGQQYQQSSRRKSEAAKAITEEKWFSALSAVKKHAMHLGHAVKLEFGSHEKMKNAVQDCVNQFKIVKRHFDPPTNNTKAQKVESLLREGKVKEAARTLQQYGVRMLNKYQQGNGDDMDNDFGYHKFFDCYNADAIDTILQLRIKAIDDLNGMKKLCVLGAFSLDEDGTEAVAISKKVKQAFAKNIQTVLVPYNIDHTHWVGIIFENVQDGFEIKYLDPQNNPAPVRLEEDLLSQFENSNFSVIRVEQQQAGNCGPEVVEDFIEYIGGTRVPQDIAVIEHSKLMEQHLLGINLDYVE